jgi:hypothetical protein
MMENQTNTDILNNPNAPFINWYASVANQATNYFAVGHPSAPNYLEIIRLEFQPDQRLLAGVDQRGLCRQRARKHRLQQRVHADLGPGAR